MALPIVLTGSTFCQGEKKAEGKQVSPFLYPGLQLPVHSWCHGSAASPLSFLCCVTSTKVSHLHPPPPPQLCPWACPALSGHVGLCPKECTPGRGDVPGSGSVLGDQEQRHARDATASCKALHSTKPSFKWPFLKAALPITFSPS